ncbi:hypothetical protein ACJX0J_011011 [Zea mays]
MHLLMHYCKRIWHAVATWSGIDSLETLTIGMPHTMNEAEGTEAKALASSENLREKLRVIEQDDIDAEIEGIETIQIHTEIEKQKQENLKAFSMLFFLQHMHYLNVVTIYVFEEEVTIDAITAEEDLNWKYVKC